MDWMQFIGLILAIGGLFIWSRTESNADRRELRNVLDTNLRAIADEMKEFRDGMNDFHSRLLILEDRYLRLREKE